VKSKTRLSINLLIALVLLIAIAYEDNQLNHPRMFNPYVSAQDLTPTATPKPTYQDIVAYIVKKFSPEGKTVVKQALEVAYGESGWRVDAYNYNTNNTGDYGPFQINSCHLKNRGTKFMHDAYANIDTAYEIYKEQGWCPWVAAQKLGYCK
jgi:hypothetical protein